MGYTCQWGWKSAKSVMKDRKNPDVPEILRDENARAPPALHVQLSPVPRLLVRRRSKARGPDAAAQRLLGQRTRVLGRGLCLLHPETRSISNKKRTDKQINSKHQLKLDQNKTIETTETRSASNKI